MANSVLERVRAELVDEVASCNSHVTSKQAEIRKLEGEIAELDSETAEMEQAIEHLHKTGMNGRLEEKRAELVKERDLLKQQRGRKLVELGKCNAQLSQLEERVKQDELALRAF